jgi:hypothetical protein
MMLACVPLAAAREPLLLPLSEAPWVDAEVVAATVAGGARTGSVGTGWARVEGNIARRVGLAVQAQASTAELTPVLEGSVKAALLSQADDKGADLGVAIRYKRDGFGEEPGEIEGILAAGRRFGRTDVLGNLVVGTGIEEPERDAELSAAAVVALSERVAVGGDAQGRMGFGEEEEERKEEEGGRRFDVSAGPFVNVRMGRVVGMVTAGGTLTGHREGGVTPGLAGGAAVRLGF